MYFLPDKNKKNTTGRRMDKKEIKSIAADYIKNSNDNYINEKYAISKKLIGTKIFNIPIFSFGSADDELFKKLKEPSVIGEHFLLPKEWLTNAKTVISFFLPFSKQVRESNYHDQKWPSAEWLHARIEGQELLNKLCSFLKEKIEKENYKSIVPIFDSRFWSNTNDKKKELNKNKNQLDPPLFTSNWSERHTAYICGLGTFGLSKGLITKKGIAGRFGSIVTEKYFRPDKRKYDMVSEYCSRCGECAKQCPVNAISLQNGKNHFICSDFLKITRSKYSPRYGCGKCQVNVPCENKIPIKPLKEST